MEKEILDKLKAKECENQPSQNFIKGLPLYEMQLEGVDDVYFSECDFNNGKDLRERDVVQFLIMRFETVHHFNISKKLCTNTDFLRYLVNNIK